MQPLISIDSGVPKSMWGSPNLCRFRDGGSPYLRGPQIYMTPGALSHSILRFSLRLLRCLRGSLREHDCAISTIDPEASLRELQLRLYFAVRNTSVFSNFHNATIVIQQTQNLRYDVRIHTYIHTYIHTDTARVQHVTVGLAQARPNNVLSSHTE